MSPRPDAPALLGRCLPDLSAAALARLAGAAEVVEVPPRGRIMAEGGEADALYVVADGIVQLSLHQRERDLPVATVSVGELLGWSWLAPPHRWDFDGASMDGATLVRVPAGELRALMSEDPRAASAISAAMLGVVSRRLRDTRIQLLDLFARIGAVEP